VGGIGPLVRSVRGPGALARPPATRRAAAGLGEPMKQRRAAITALGTSVPERLLTNADLEKMVDTSDEWIRTRTGIRTRHIVEPGTPTSALAAQAAAEALRRRGIGAEELDLVIVATVTPDMPFPATAAFVQERIGARNAWGFDLSGACSGFVYALSVGAQFVASGTHSRVMVIGADVMSAIMDFTDRTTCVLFGDGAGAVVLQASDEPGILSTHLHADGSYNELLTVNYGVSTNYELMLKEEAFIQMKGNEVFKMAVNTLGRIVDETLEHNQLDKTAVDWLVPHQANTRIIQATAKKLKMSMDHVVLTVDKHGNTSAASVPLALDAAVRDGRIQRGETLLLEAFGGGFTWGSALIKY
jgi:3-oxoacyl-[acyl-carrier-protein] synthase-3